MGLDIWFKEDIANILRAADAANLAAMVAADRDYPEALAGEPARLRQAYRDGFAAALATVAMALGLPVPTIAAGTRPPPTDRTRELTGTSTLKHVRLPRR